MDVANSGTAAQGLKADMSVVHAQAESPQTVVDTVVGAVVDTAPITNDTPQSEGQ